MLGVLPVFIWEKATTPPVRETRNESNNNHKERWRRHKPQDRVVRAVGFNLQWVPASPERLGKMQVSLLNHMFRVRGPANLLFSQVLLTLLSVLG